MMYRAGWESSHYIVCFSWLLQFSDVTVAERGQMALQILSLGFTGLCMLKNGTIFFPSRLDFSCIKFHYWVYPCTQDHISWHFRGLIPFYRSCNHSGKHSLSFASAWGPPCHLKPVVLASSFLLFLHIQSTLPFLLVTWESKFVRCKASSSTNCFQLLGTACYFVSV